MRFTAKLWRGISPNDFDMGNVSEYVLDLI